MFGTAPVYPTRDEILAQEPSYLGQVLERTKAFKKLWHLAEGNDELRLNLIKELLQDLNATLGGEALTISAGPAYCYSPARKELFIKAPTSIISCLHELGHHLYGSSELLACQFSVHLFKSVFPKAYLKLRWEGHMLKKEE